MHRLLNDLDARRAEAPGATETLAAPEAPDESPSRVDSLTLDIEPLDDRAINSIAPQESTHSRVIWLALMIGVVALYAFAVFSFWAPADGGIDQNAYLV